MFSCAESCVLRLESPLFLARERERFRNREGELPFIDIPPSKSCAPRAIVKVAVRVLSDRQLPGIQFTIAPRPLRPRQH